MSYEHSEMISKESFGEMILHICIFSCLKHIFRSQRNPIIILLLHILYISTKWLLQVSFSYFYLKSHQSLKDEAKHFVLPKFWLNSNFRGFCWSYCQCKQKFSQNFGRTKCSASSFSLWCNFILNVAIDLSTNCLTICFWFVNITNGLSLYSPK